MSDSVYGRVFDSSTSGWIADVILDIENNNIDPSLAEIWAYEAIQDASISALEASIGTSMDYPYVDGSLSARDLSINELYTLVETQDPSISNLYSTKQDLIPDGTFLKESSLGTDFVWNAGLLDVSIISIDGSVNDLYNYVEDLSTYTYSHSHAQDASIADLYQEIENIPQDASIPYLFTYTLDLSTRLDNFDPAQDGSIVDLYNIKENKTDVDSSLGDLYSYVDGSLAVQTSWNTSQDASIVGLRNADLSQDASLGLINTNLDNVETSLGVLNNWNVSQDASLALKANISDTYTRTYIDGSLAAKQDIITDGTFLKESSIGDGLFWVDGQLDVSVEGGGGSTTLEALTDTSVAGRSSGDFLYYNNDTSTWDNISSIDISTIYENAVDHFIQGVGNLIEVSIGNSIPDGSTLIWMADGEYWGVGSVPTDFYSQTYVDGSLNAKAGLTDLPTDFYSQAYVDGSLGTLQGVNTSQDASIVILRNKDIDIDASIGLINTNLDNIETSLGVINGWNVSQDASIDELRNKDISQDASIVLKADKTYVDANFVPNASIGDGLVWNAGQLDVSVAGGAQDPSIGDLYSIKENKTDVDSSLADVYTFIGDIPQDASIPNLYSVKADKTEIPTDFYSQAYVDGSLGTLQGVNTAQDASIVILRNKDIDIDASIVALRTTNNNQDTSIGILNNWNVSQDASLALKANISDTYTRTYIDGSLNLKQDLIPAGTYVKEASLGDGLFWVDGQLDVSVASSGGVSQEYVDGSLNTLRSWNTSQDASLALKANSADIIKASGQLIRDSSLCYITTTSGSWTRITQIYLESDVSSNMTLDGSNGYIINKISGLYYISAKATFYGDNVFVYFAIGINNEVIEETTVEGRGDTAYDRGSYNTHLIKYLEPDSSISIYASHTGSNSINSVNNIIFSAHKID